MKDLIAFLIVTFGIITTTLFFIFFGTFIGAFFVWLCWNCIMPVIFTLPSISYWQSFLMTFMCNILFKTNITTQNQKKD